MWITVLVMAIAVSLEPFRIGMTVLMINRPRPLLQLLAFLTGGFAMGIAVGVIVLFILRPALGSAHFTLPRVQIVVGAVLLVNAARGGLGRWGQARRRICGHCEGRFGWLAMRPGNCSTAAHCGRRVSRVSASRCRPSTISPYWRSLSPPAPRPRSRSAPY